MYVRSASTLLLRLLMALFVSLIPLFSSIPAVRAQPQIIIVVNTENDGPVSPTNTDGLCSLREAVEAVNTAKAVDTCPAGGALAGSRNHIHFSIQGVGNYPSIVLTEGPVVIRKRVTIDGTTQGCGGGPCIRLSGSTKAKTGLHVKASQVVVEGLILNRFDTAAIHLDSAGNQIIDNNYIGTTQSGTTGLGNGIGVLVENTSNSSIGTAAVGNIISANKQGIVIRGDSERMTIENNRIGAGINGTEDLGNDQEGIAISSSGQNNIGRAGINSGNLIANNDIGLRISGSTASQNKVYNNIFGTSSTYSVNMLNNVNIRLDGGANNNRIGDITNGTGNVIAHGEIGVMITGADTKENLVVRNFIGVAPDSANHLGASTGVLINDGAYDNYIGTTNSNLGNVIGHNITGIRIAGADTRGNDILANRIGVHNNDEIVRNRIGVHILEGASSNRIGSTAQGAGNIIGANGTGVLIAGANSINNFVIGNGIGTDLQGGANLGNDDDGVFIDQGAHNNSVGGTADGDPNIIAYNGQNGVVVTGQSTRNRILGNRIFANEKLGIDLSADNGSPDGVTANDDDDKDGKGNLLQNYPVLVFAAGIESQATAAFTFRSTPNTTFRIEFFTNGSLDPSGYGEGQYYAGHTDVTTDGSGNAAIVADVAGAGGNLITATATDPDGNTSEFSPSVEIFDLRVCFFTGLLGEELLLDDFVGADWHVGENWECEPNLGLLPDDATQTLIGDKTDLTDQQFALIQPGNEASANDVQINPASGLTVQGNLTATQVTNDGLLSIAGDTTIDFSLSNQPGSTLTLGDPNGASGTATVTGMAMLDGTIEGSGTLNLSSAKSTLTGVISPGFGELGTGSLLGRAASVEQGGLPLTATVALVGDTDLVSATLAIDLFGGGASDRLAIQGRAQVGGTLRLRPAQSAVNAAQAGASYTIVTCSQGCQGAFERVETPPGYTASVEVQANAVVVSLDGGSQQTHTTFLPDISRP